MLAIERRVGETFELIFPNGRTVKIRVATIAERRFVELSLSYPRGLSLIFDLRQQEIRSVKLFKAEIIKLFVAKTASPDRVRIGIDAPDEVKILRDDAVITEPRSHDQKTATKHL